MFSQNDSLKTTFSKLIPQKNIIKIATSKKTFSKLLHLIFPSKNTFSKFLPQTKHFQNCSLKKDICKIVPSKKHFKNCSFKKGTFKNSPVKKGIFKRGFQNSSFKKCIFKIAFNSLKVVPSKKTLLKLLSQKDIAISTFNLFLIRITRTSFYAFGNMPNHLFSFSMYLDSFTKRLWIIVSIFFKSRINSDYC